MKTLKVVLVLTLVFLAGAAGGVVATRMAVRHFVDRAIANPDIVRERIERQLARKLNLDRQQRITTAAALKQAHEKLKALREQFQPQFTNIIQDARSQINAVLNPEQQKQFEDFQEQNRRFFQR
jgi:hypothetical protein